MADKEEKPTEQPKGGDHIPATNEEEEEQQAPQGLLSKIGDPVGTFLSCSVPIPPPPGGSTAHPLLQHI